MINLKNPIMLALDVDTDQQALALMDQVSDLIGAIKVGPRLNLKYGATLIEKIKDVAPVFIDNKFFDITTTVISSVQTAFDVGATFVTVHALNGSETLSELAKLEKKLNQIRPFKVLCVTVLTSWSNENFPSNFKNLSIEEHVRNLALIVEQSGLSGLVCSGHELKLIPRHFFKVVPGIRTIEEIQNSIQQDQKRVMNPLQALQSGANALVIGRSIIQAEKPREIVKNILESLQL